MALFGRLFGKKNTVEEISSQQQKTVFPTQSIIPETAHMSDIFESTTVNLRSFKHAVLRDWSGDPITSVNKCTCSFYQKNHICAHVYMKALDDGLFREVFSRGATLNEMANRLSDGAFAVFSDFLYEGYYDQKKPLITISGFEQELEDAELIILEDDGFWFSQAVQDNLFYALYLFLTDMRAAFFGFFR